MGKFGILVGSFAIATTGITPSWAVPPNNIAYVQPATGTDSGTCGAATSPCATLNQALANVSSGGNIYVLSGGTFGPIYLTTAVSIHGPPDDSLNIIWSNAAPGCVGAAAGTCAATSNYAVDMEAASSDVFKFRYVIFNNGAGTNGAMKIGNAFEVKMYGVDLRGGTGSPPQLLLAEPTTATQFQLLIQKGNIGFSNGVGVEVAPGAGNADVTILDSVINNNAGGILLKPAAGGSINAALDHVTIVNNNGGGIRADSSNGPITVDISDSVIVDNVANGLNISSGTGTQNDMANVIRTTIAKNGLNGIQTGGSNAAVLLNASTLDSNTNGATSASNGARIISYGNNQIIGPAGSGFTGTAPLQ